MRVLIVDDEAPARQHLRMRLEQWPDVQVVGEARSGREALEMVEQLAPEVVFLDVAMPGLDGLAVARALANRNPPPRVVFVTAHERYAVDAFSTRACDYLLKPFDDERLQESLSRLRESFSSTAPAAGARPAGNLRWLLCHQEETAIPVPLQELVYVEAQGDYVTVYTSEGKALRGRYSIQELAELLPADRFFRCHRCYIVNVAYVQEILAQPSGTYLLRLKGFGKTLVPVSRRNGSRLRQYFG